jgi:hypothetical protein
MSGFLDCYGAVLARFFSCASFRQFVASQLSELRHWPRLFRLLPLSGVLYLRKTFMIYMGLLHVFLKCSIISLCRAQTHMIQACVARDAGRTPMQQAASNAFSDSMIPAIRAMRICVPMSALSIHGH